MKSDEISQIVKGFQFETTSIQDAEAELNLLVAVPPTNHPVHLVVSKQPSGIISALSRVTLSDEHWKKVIALDQKTQIKMTARMKQLLILYGAEYSLQREKEDDPLFRDITILFRKDLSDCTRGSILDMLTQARNGILLATTVIQEYTS